MTLDKLQAILDAVNRRMSCPVVGLDMSPQTKAEEDGRFLAEFAISVLADCSVETSLKLPSYDQESTKNESGPNLALQARAERLEEETKNLRSSLVYNVRMASHDAWALASGYVGDLADKVVPNGAECGLVHLARIFSYKAEDARVGGAMDLQPKLRELAKEFMPVATTPAKCAIKDCPNKSDEGVFVGPLCAPCSKEHYRHWKTSAQAAAEVIDRMQKNARQLLVKDLVDVMDVWARKDAIDFGNWLRDKINRLESGS